MSRCGFDNLSKLENLRKFCFWTTGCVSEQQADDKLLLLLQTVPKLKKAGRISSLSDDRFLLSRSTFLDLHLQDMSKVLNACLNPLLLCCVSVTPELLARPLSEIVPSASQLDLIDYQTFSSNLLGLQKVTELNFHGYFSQAAFNATVQNYGRQLKVLRVSQMTDDLELDVVAENCSNLERLLCSSDIVPLPDRFENPWPRLNHLVIHTIHSSYSERLEHIFLCAENIQYLNCDFTFLIGNGLHNENFRRRRFLFPKLVKAVLNSDSVGIADVKEFLLQAPKLKHLTLIDWPGGRKDRIAWLAHVPGLNVVYADTY